MIKLMIKLMTKFLLSLSSFSGVLYFFVVTNLDKQISDQTIFNLNFLANGYIRHGSYIVIFAFFAFITLVITRKVFPKADSLEVREIKPIESVAVPTYIGLFVIALGLNQIPMPVPFVILTVLFLFWTRLEKIFYFNPIWLFFGYRFYEVKSSNDNTYTLITKRDRLKGEQDFTSLRRLNNYTFLES